MEMIIGGKFIDKAEKILVKNPYNGDVIDYVPSGSEEDILSAITIAEKGAEINRNLPVYERVSILKKTASLMEERFEELVKTITLESSKTIREARKEVTRAINTISLSAEEASRITGETIPFDSMSGSEKRTGYYYRFPVGIIGAITPFNDPLNLVAHKLGPAIAGGNAIVLKPATETPLSALLLGKIFLDAGLPPEIISIVTGYGNKIGSALAKDERIGMISFTGGVETGKEIAKVAGLKKIGMELGSNSPVIVMNDADIDKAVESCVSGAFWAAGQNCIGVQRILIQSEVYDYFKEKFVARTSAYKTGCKMDEATDMGPMINEKEAERVIEWISEAEKKGGKILTGGKRNGALVEPTVLENIHPEAKIDKQEIFGPVVSLYKFDELEDAIKKANDVEYGLHAAIFTNDLNTAFFAVKNLHVGGVMVNDSTDYRIDSMPFGGVKKSGIGREGVRFALEEMTEKKVVCFNLE